MHCTITYDNDDKAVQPLGKLPVSLLLSSLRVLRRQTQGRHKQQEFYREGHATPALAVPSIRCIKRRAALASSIFTQLIAQHLSELMVDSCDGTVPASVFDDRTNDLHTIRGTSHARNRVGRRAHARIMITIS